MRVVDSDGRNTWAVRGDAAGGATGTGLGGTGQAGQVLQTADVQLGVAEDYAQARSARPVLMYR